MWKPNDRLVHRFNDELGPGRVVSVDGRTVTVEFPSSEQILRLAADSDALVPLQLSAGMRVRDRDGAVLEIESVLDDGRCQLRDGRTVDADELWPVAADDGPFARLARGDVDPPASFLLRLDALRLTALRAADGLGSFLGGRIQLFPHQLHVAERATRADPVRWLLADEVGLGKTVEACLILNRLIHTRRAERVLIIAPDTLTVQWLGELWRKYHQVYVLLDEARLADVAKDYGAGFNPFDAYRQVVLGLDTLLAHPELGDQATAAGLDLLIVDEAHHLRRPPGHPGNPAYRAVAPLTRARHVLLLSATPLEDDAHGFFRLLQLLRPDELPDETAFADQLEQRLATGEPLPPCTSSTRRTDIGGLPPRVPTPVETGDDSDWKASLDLVRATRALPADNAARRKVKADRVRRALSSGASLDAVLGPADGALKRIAARALTTDPRTSWLAAQATAWHDAGHKTLVFVAERDTLEAVRAALSRLASIRTGVFHEDLAPARRDIEVAQFRLPSGPSLLLSTECGGEGRNFEFCRRLVLFDLPWNPAVVEQRIGRLDRIGRDRPVEVVYFRPPSGLGAAIVSLYEDIGLFKAPLGGLDRELGHVEEALIEACLSDLDPVPIEHFQPVIEEAREARTRVIENAYHELHRDPFRSSMSEPILARVPAELDALTEAVVTTACARFGFDVDRKRGRRAYSIELGSHALVDHLPGVPGGSSFLGTFDRTEAVDDEAIDFFASGHALVEGVLAALDENSVGRAALLALEADDDDTGLGLLAVYRSDDGFELVAIDVKCRPRPEWAALLETQSPRPWPPTAVRLTQTADWAGTVERMAKRLSRTEPPIAVAALRVGKLS